MKIVRLIFFTCFGLLFFSLNCFSAKSNNSVLNNINIQQSPLSDDQTDPINKSNFDFAGFDLKENDSQYSISNSFTILPTASINNHLLNNSDILTSPNNKYIHPLPPHYLHSSSSYLSIFKI